MPDLYLTISEQPDTMLDVIADALDARAADPAMQAICERYMAGLPNGDVVEIGCGAGAASELVLRNVRPARLTGIDPAEGLLVRARERFAGRARTDFRLGTAAATGLPDRSADMVIAHTVFSHLAKPDAALAEAHRILRPGGTLVIFDGDYATNTVALYDGDPLQTAMEAARRNMIHAPYVMRHLPRLLRAAGFAPADTEPHGYIQGSDYILSLIRRGVDISVARREFGETLGEGLKAEAQRRVADGTFYGAILFASISAVRH